MIHIIRPAILEFEFWGSGDPKFVILNDVTVQSVLLAIRTPKSVEELSHEVHADGSEIGEKLMELESLDLVTCVDDSRKEWLAKIPIFIKSDSEIAFEIAEKHARIESEILRRALADLEITYNTCRISNAHPWSRMSLIVAGAILADLCVSDRVRFFPQYFKEAFLPPLHPDGKRWRLIGFEKGANEFPGRKWAFYQNGSSGEGGRLQRFGYYKPDEKRQRPPDRPEDLYDTPFKHVLLNLYREPLSYSRLLKESGLDPATLQEVLESVESLDPPAVQKQNGKYALMIPIFSESDIGRMISCADRSAEQIYKKVTIPSQEECVKASSSIGLRFPLNGWDTLPRDLAIQYLVEDGLIGSIPDPPVPWNWCVWGWEGDLPFWEELRT